MSGMESDENVHIVTTTEANDDVYETSKATAQEARILDYIEI